MEVNAGQQHNYDTNQVENCAFNTEDFEELEFIPQFSIERLVLREGDFPEEGSFYHLLTDNLDGHSTSQSVRSLSVDTVQRNAEYRSFWSSVFNCLASILGSGTLAIPFAMRKSGFLISHLMFVCTAFINAASLNLIISASTMASKTDALLSPKTPVRFRDYSSPVIRTNKASACSPSYKNRASPSQASRLLSAPPKKDSTSSLARNNFNGLTINYNSYEKLAYRTMGPAGVFLIAFIFCLCGLGLLMANFLFISQCFLNCLLGRGNYGLLEIRVALVAVTSLVVFPLSLVRSILTLRYSSFLSFFTTCFIAVLMTSRLLFAFILHGRSLFDKFDGYLGSPPDSDFFFTLSVFVSAFSCQLQILPIYAKLQNKSEGLMLRVGMTSIITAGCIYEAVGLSGYGLFGSSTSENILSNFSEASAAPAFEVLFQRIANMAVGIALCAAAPMAIWPLRSCLISVVHYRTNLRDGRDLRACRAAGLEMPASKTLWFATTMSVIAAATTFSILLPSVSVALRVVGSFGGSTIAFILPGVFWILIRMDYHRLLGKHRKRTPGKKFVLPAALIVLGFIFGTASLSSSIYKVVLQQAQHT